MEPNWFAYFALASWPLVALYLYSTRPLAEATLWTILGAVLLLPTGAAIKLQGIPALDKVSVGNLAALIGCLLVSRRPPRFWNGFGIVEALVLTCLISPFITAELNTDPIVIGNRILPPEDHYDAVSSVVGALLFILPFFLGRQFLNSSADVEKILRTLVIAGLLYSIPTLFEVRMSPQLHNWIYGFFPVSVAPEMRGGGAFRPVVFLATGLALTFFMMTTVAAAACLWRTRARVVQLPAAAITGYLTTVLLLCNSLAAQLYGALALVLIRLTKPRLQVLVAVVLVSIALLYPMLRAGDLVPTATMVDAAATFSNTRAGSLQMRFDQEKQLLDHANPRLFFGWGRWGRNRVYDESGNDISLTDGSWAIVVGIFGLVGFFVQFTLLSLPVFRAAFALKFTESAHDKIQLATLTLIVAISVFDLLPNAFLTPWTWLIAGALLGRAERLIVVARRRMTSKSHVILREAAN
jgi:hypothetical protein